MTKEQLEEEAYQYDADHLRGARGARWYHNVTIKEAYLAAAVPREKRITELEKENAKLKERADDADLNSVLFFNQLCKAKELIKKMLPLMPSGYNDMGNSDLVFEIREEAEQFLEEEK